MAKNYYLILGVPFDAAPDEIRTAFRKLAFRHHPDRRHEASPGRFRAIAEAYGVLSDPARRARYDRELRGQESRSRGDAVTPRVADPEPWVSEPVSILGEPEIVRPSYEALLERLGRNFAGLGAPKAEHAEPLNFELILTPEEAGHGILVPFRVPVFATCQGCAGLGRDWLFQCADCEGEGRVIVDDAVDVRVPGGVRDGTVIEVSLERLGIHNLWLRVHVRVERH